MIDTGYYLVEVARSVGKQEGVGQELRCCCQSVYEDTLCRSSYKHTYIRTYVAHCWWYVAILNLSVEI